MHLRMYSHVILQKIRFCTILYLRTFQKPIFSFGRLICMPKMAKPKTPEMSSPSREEESEYRNGLTHKLNFRSGDTIPTVRFCITHLLFCIIHFVVELSP